MAHVHPTGLQKSAIRVVLPGAEQHLGRGLQLRTSGGIAVLADGMLVGSVPTHRWF